jgi:hypothetical protein
MKNKKKPNYFFKCLNILFIVFISLYIANESGYYEAKISKKTSLTKAAMQQFESDVKNNKEIDLKDYMLSDDIDYGNNTTNVAIYIGGKVEKFMSTGINDLFNVIKSLVS